MEAAERRAPTPLSMARPHSPLANQVAGHKNVMCDESGSLVMKPALPREIAFYQLLAESPRSAPLARLRPFVPKFLGTLKLEGRIDGKGGLQSNIPEQAEVPESVVLENLAHAFTRPSILDVKLGTVLYSPEATEEKKARMEKQARESTSFETGIRLTGSQTWHAPSKSYILTPKSYGKALSADELPLGMMRFFPSPDDIIPSVIPSANSAPASASTTFSDASHLPVPNAPIAAAEAKIEPSTLPSSPPATYTNHAIPPATLVELLDLIDTQLEALEAAVTSLEMRFIGASVLIVYEGDAARLEEALERYRNMPIKPPVPFADPDGDVEDEDEDDENDDEDDDTSSDDDSMDGARMDARVKRRCPPFTVKLIDFAHTRLAEGEGPDEGVLKGLRTLRGLVRGRTVALRQATSGTQVATGI